MQRQQIFSLGIYPKLLQYSLCILIGIFCTWYVMGIRVDKLKAQHQKRLSQITAERTQELLTRNELVRNLEKKYNDTVQKHQDSITQKEEEYQKSVTSRIMESVKLRHKLNTGAYGLRFVQSKSSENRVHPTPVQGSAPTECSCRGCYELDAGSRETYINLREGLQGQYEKLILCKQYAEEINKLRQATK